MPKESEMNRITAKTGTLLIRVVNDADGTADSANMTSANLAAEIASAVGDVTSVNGATGAVVLDAADIAFTPEGTVAATTVQAAIVEAASEGGSGDGIPFPDVEGTDGQVLAITGTDPSLEVGWVDASDAVGDAIATHDAATNVHGITDTTALLDSSDIGVNVQEYQATTSHMVQYAAGWPARPDVPAGTVIYVNNTDDTAPADDEAGDLIFLTEA